MYCVGLTGSIASGKSTAAALFKKLGIAVMSADEEARELVANKSLLETIKNHFGSAVIDTSGQLNRRTLRHIIFNEPQERLWLEQLLHPLIRQRLATKIAEVASPYCVVEIPLLNKRSDYPYLNRVLFLMADQEKQIARVMQRDQCSREHALQILAAQGDNTARKEIADDIIVNNGSQADLAEKIENLHLKYLQNARF